MTPPPTPVRYQISGEEFLRNQVLLPTAVMTCAMVSTVLYLVGPMFPYLVRASCGTVQRHRLAAQVKAQVKEKLRAESKRFI